MGNSSDVEELELVQFISVAKELGVTGFPYELYNNDICEVQSNEKLKTISKQGDIVKENSKKAITSVSQPENTELVWSKINKMLCGLGIRQSRYIGIGVRASIYQYNYVPWICEYKTYIVTRWHFNSFLMCSR